MNNNIQGGGLYRSVVLRAQGFVHGSRIFILQSDSKQTDWFAVNILIHIIVYCLMTKHLQMSGC